MDICVVLSRDGKASCGVPPLSAHSSVFGEYSRSQARLRFCLREAQNEFRLWFWLWRIYTETDYWHHSLIFFHTNLALIPLLHQGFQPYGLLVKPRRTKLANHGHSVHAEPTAEHVSVGFRAEKLRNSTKYRI